MWRIKEFQTKKNPGFTLMEIILAIMVIVVVSIVLANTMAGSLWTTSETQDIVKATDMAQRYMETVRTNLAYSINYDNTLAGTTPPVAITSDFTDNNFFTVKTTVNDLDTQVINGVNTPVLKEIDIEYLRTSDSVSLIRLSTLITRPR